MVLNELGGRITRALRQMSAATLIDDGVLDACMKEICTALIQADVNVKLVMGLRTNVKAAVNLEEMAAGLNKRKIIEKAVFTELCKIMDGAGDAKPFQPKKKAVNVVMFVGLQGSGKTTTCTKYAYHYQRKGWKPALVCADTFRAGAYDQLKQNATKARIPFYGSYTETDPVLIAQAGCDRFRAEGCDLIIVDTSGRHKQEASLFEEMRAVAEAVQPDAVVFVMDSSIGQAAHDQAAAFKQAVAVGAVIVTKLDGHAKGGGALSAVAATQSPVIFTGTGEHIDEFEPFETKAFVSRLLGQGDWSGFMDKIGEAIPAAGRPELMQKLSEGQFTLRIMQEQFQNISRMGNIGQVMSMIPGFGAELLPKGREAEGSAKIKRYMTLMDAMTDKELDSSNPKLFAESSRILRVARGAGYTPRDVLEMLEEYKRLTKIWSKMKGMKIPPKGDMSALSRNMNAAQMGKILPPAMLKQIGGQSALANMMKSLAGADLKGFMGMGGGGD